MSGLVKAHLPIRSRNAAPLNQPVELMQLIETLEKRLGKTASKNMLPMQPGDVPDRPKNYFRIYECAGE